MIYRETLIIILPSVWFTSWRWTYVTETCQVFNNIYFSESSRLFVCHRKGFLHECAALCVSVVETVVWLVSTWLFLQRRGTCVGGGWKGYISFYRIISVCAFWILFRVEETFAFPAKRQWLRTRGRTDYPPSSQQLPGSSTHTHTTKRSPSPSSNCRKLLQSLDFHFHPFFLSF